MQLNTPTKAGVVGGIVTVDPVQSAQGYTFQFVELTGKPITTKGEYGYTPSPSPASYYLSAKLKRKFMKRFRAGKPSCKLVVTATSNTADESDPLEMPIDMDRTTARDLNRMIPSVSWPKWTLVAIIAIIVGITLFWWKPWNKFQNPTDAPDRSSEVEKLEREKDALKKERDQLMEATNKFGSKLTNVTAQLGQACAESIEASNKADALKNELASLKSKASPTDLPVATNTAPAQQAQPVSQYQPPQQVNVPTNSPVSFENNDVRVTGSGIGAIINSAVTINYPTDTRASAHADTESQCAKTGWVGGDQPDEVVYISGDFPLYTQTNVVVTPGKSMMIIFPAHYLIHADQHDIQFCHVKTGDDCGPRMKDPKKQKDNLSPSQVHGHVRVLVIPKTEEEVVKEGFSFTAAPFYFRFAFTKNGKK
jgi:hypothetical protein